MDSASKKEQAQKDSPSLESTRKAEGINFPIDPRTLRYRIVKDTLTAALDEFFAVAVKEKHVWEVWVKAGVSFDSDFTKETTPSAPENK